MTADNSSSLSGHPLFARARIFAPGPTPVPEMVLGVLAQSPLHHRTQGFNELLSRVRKNLQFLFQTTQPVFVLSSSGTGAMETAVNNTTAPGDKVIVINGGKFGERWTKISQKFGLKVVELTVPWGSAVTPEKVTEALREHPDTRAVLLQASETSTATAHPVEAIAKAVRGATPEALVVVDAITALGVSDLRMDAWDLDIVITGSQKALMLPPGLAFLALSPRANAMRKRATHPRFYFDLASEEKAAASGETAWTPAVSLIAGLDCVLARLREVGLERVFSHHAKLAEGTRRGIQALGLELLSKSPSNAVTAAIVPAGVDGGKIISYLRDTYSMTVAEGQDAYKGKMFRLAHLGYFDELDMLTVLSAVEMTLKKLGASIQLGKGVGAAAQYFSDSTATRK